MPEDATFLHMIKEYRDVLGHLLRFEEALMRGPSSLSPVERELIAAFTSGLNECSYCYRSHSYTVAHLGIDRATVDALIDDVETAAVDDKLKPLLRYVRKLNETPHKLVEADAAAVYDAGWDDNALMTATTVCAYFNFCNRMSDGVGLDIPDDQLNSIAGVLARDGYMQAYADAGVSPPE
jgi:uncharacterized peroxidase-related enzyme